MKVEYIDKNGYLIETKEAVYVFDYVDGRLPSHYLRQEKPLLFFVSSKDKGHYGEGIYSYRKTVVLSYDVDVTPYSKVFKVRPGDVLHLGFSKVYAINNPKRGVCYVIEENDKKYLFTGGMNFNSLENSVHEFNAYQKELFLNVLKELSYFAPFDVAIVDFKEINQFIKYCRPNHLFPIGSGFENYDTDLANFYKPKYSNYVFEVKDV